MASTGSSPEVVNLITKIVLNTASRQDFLDVSPTYSEIFESMTSNVSMSALESFGIKTALNNNAFNFDDGGEYYLYGVAINPKGKNYEVFYRESYI